MELNDLRYRKVITGKKARNIENNKLPMTIKIVSDVIEKIKNIILKNAIMEYGTHSIIILSFSNVCFIFIHNAELSGRGVFVNGNRFTLKPNS
jgi:hypothetical protein